MGGAVPWLWKLPGYMGPGAPGCELGGVMPEGTEVDGTNPIGGTPGLGVGGRPPGVEDEGGSGGPDKLAAGMGGPVGEKGPPVEIGCGWNG